MSAKQTTLDAYLARTSAIHAKLERLQQLACRRALNSDQRFRQRSQGRPAPDHGQ